MSDGAWQRFYCAGCQAERDVSERVRRGNNLSRCIRCTGRIKPGRKPVVRYDDADDAAAVAIPDDVMAAYLEARE